MANGQNILLEYLISVWCTWRIPRSLDSVVHVKDKLIWSDKTHEADHWFIWISHSVSAPEELWTRVWLWLCLCVVHSEMLSTESANVCFAFDRFRCFVYVKYLAIFMQLISNRIKRLIKHWTNGWMSGFQPFRFVDIFQAFTYSSNEYPCQKCNYHILRSFQLLFHRFFR